MFSWFYEEKDMMLFVSLGKYLHFLEEMGVFTYISLWVVFGLLSVFDCWEFGQNGRSHPAKPNGPVPHQNKRKPIQNPCQKPSTWTPKSTSWHLPSALPTRQEAVWAFRILVRSVRTKGSMSPGWRVNQDGCRTDPFEFLVKTKLLI